MKNYKKFFALAGASVMALGVTASLSSCGTFKGVMIWGPQEHEQLYLDAVKAFKESNPDFKAAVRYGASGDAGAQAALSVDPQSGGSIYTFANDQLINIRRIGAISKLDTDSVNWIKQNHVAAACEAGKIGNDYFAYPVSADNGFVLVYNKDAFRDTKVWDSATDGLKQGYTFRDLFNALDERGAQPGHEKWANGLALWPSGSAWYESGVFFATGGDYSVTYDEKGNQTAASCSFGYKTVNGVEDYTIGLEAVRCMINTFTNEDGTISKHFMYSDDSNPAYNDIVSKYSGDLSGVSAEDNKPLAAMVTWNNSILRTNWGDDYAATVLPTLESGNALEGGEGHRYTWKSFSGFKLMGVNPLCAYAQSGDGEENYKMLHKLARYLTDVNVSLDRYKETGLGPSNFEAQKNEEIQKDKFLKALNEQYSLNDGKGARVQDSTPSNYWTPIATFGNVLFDAIKNGKKGQFDTVTNVKRMLKQLQTDIESAAK